MKFCYALTALALSPVPAFAAEVVPSGFVCVDKATDPAKFELARGIVNASIPPDEGDQMTRQLIESVLGSVSSSSDFPFVDPQSKAIFDRRMKEIPDRLLPIINRHMPAMYGAVACAYAREFSLVELTEAHTFALTPTGRRFLAYAPKLMADPDVQKAFQAYMADVQTMTREFGREVAQEVIEAEAKRKKK